MAILEIEWIFCSANADANANDLNYDADNDDVADKDADNAYTGDGDEDDKDDAHDAVKCGAVVLLMQAGAKNFYLLIVSIIVNIIINTTIDDIIIVLFVTIIKCHSHFHCPSQQTKSDRQMSKYFFSLFLSCMQGYWSQG